MKALWILLGILKWLGIAVLVLLALFLLLLLFVLVSPIRYRLEGEKKTALSGTFGVRWLLGAFQAEGSYSRLDGLQCRAQFLWFSLLGEKPQKKKKAKRRKKAEKSAKQTASREPISDLMAAEKHIAKSEPAPPQAADIVEEMPEPAPTAAQAIPQRMQKKEIRRVKAAKTTENMEKLQEDACFAEESTPQPKTMRRVKLSEIEEKAPQMPLEEAFSPEKDAFFTGQDETAEESLDAEEKTPSIFRTLWKIEGKKEIFRALRKLIGRILRGVLPGHFQLKGKFGLGDPVWTGYLLGFAGILQAKYGNDIQIEGDFAKIAAEDIEIKIAGKIRLGSLLGAMLAFVVAKPVRRAVQFIWKERKAEKGKGEQ